MFQRQRIVHAGMNLTISLKDLSKRIFKLKYSSLLWQNNVKGVIKMHLFIFRLYHKNLLWENIYFIRFFSTQCKRLFEAFVAKHGLLLGFVCSSLFSLAMILGRSPSTTPKDYCPGRFPITRFPFRDMSGRKELFCSFS